ncbi:MAG: MFS transporter [Chloroflexi bacterium]|nr:MFS transporter [Chloroflexota bacterium]
MQRVLAPLTTISPGWTIVAGVAFVLFGAAGSRFSFGVFLEPLTDEFSWSRGSISGALAAAGIATGLFRPVAGWLADRFDPVRVALVGLVIGGAALFGLSRIQALWHLYALFLVLGVGFTLASPATLTKLVTTAFTRRRGLALSLAGSGSAIGETALVPVSAVVLTLAGWRSAYLVLAALILFLVTPVAFGLLRPRRSKQAQPETDSTAGQQPGDGPDPARRTARSACAWMPDEGLSLRAAVRTPIFWALTAGFFT